MLSMYLGWRAKIHSDWVWKCMLNHFIHSCFAGLSEGTSSEQTIHADKIDLRRKKKLNYCTTCRLPEIVRNCCAILWIAPLCCDCFRENLCTISWQTQCHLLVKHRNNAQGSHSLTAQSLRKNAGVPAGTCAFNINRSKKKRSVTSSSSIWVTCGDQ